MKIIYLKPGKLSEGDLKILNSGERFVRRQDRVDGYRCVAHGRPCFSWVRQLPIETGLPKNQDHCLRHTLGNPERGSAPFRNYFNTGDESKDHPDILALVDRGLMRRGQTIPGGSTYYHATEAAFALLDILPETR